MLEQVREAEIAQAVDRVRPVFNRRRVIVLTNVALDLTVDHALTWPELRPGKFAYAFARHGVLPLSAGDLCRGFLDLWRLENTAKVELRRAGFYTDEKGVHFPNNIFIWSLYPILTTRYRRRNQRGAAARALVSQDLPDPRSVLESLVGELTEFHLDRPARSPADGTPEPERSMRPLPPLAAALSAEGQLRASLPPAERPPDMLGMARVMKLVTMAGELGGTARAAVA
jgi:hypothetical protein